MILYECRFIFNKGGVRMTDTIEFEIALKRAGLTKKKVAQSLGISEMGLYQKVNNITEFKASEISKLYELLNLSNLAEQQKIFFAN
ncbi:hypothetical protein HMPREF9166_1836 [Selenomonas sp. oral taxon 149 str. 67H29BP]|nr:hypothetical protein HMPREF9166_1836 [Selenomonas sp. oral taxon 149 str. 67H29BP]